MNWKVEVGDCREVMARMEPESVTAIVSDPPYGLGFMGHGWDYAVPGAEFWTAALRVLKPGGVLLAFGGTRTWHRLAVAIEDGGFTIRDSLAWLYGSGFPKSLDISKALDAEAGLEREVIGKRRDFARDGYKRADTPRAGTVATVAGENAWDCDVTIPASPESALWTGYGTALKPAFEPIILAIKPNEGTFAANARKHGVAGLNVDGCRIGVEKDWPSSRSWRGGMPGREDGEYQKTESDNLGRWPANVILDEEAGAMLDAHAGDVGGGPVHERRDNGNRQVYGKYKPYLATPIGGDSGGASRFFYCAKADRMEREAGLPGNANANTRRNSHATVKPLDLMRWLCRLVKMPKGTVILDPFCGSGSTGCAAVLEGCGFVGIEINPEYAEIARGRIAYWEKAGPPTQAKKNPAEMPGTPLFGDIDL